MNKLYIILGESNSGGIASNTSALPSEIGTKSNVQIWDNANNNGFVDLIIGGENANNLIGHTGLESYANTCHGFELFMANYINEDIIYLLKAGQGGSKIANWVENSTYYNTFCSRMDALLQVYSPDIIEVWYSLGINDAIANTNADIWYDNMVEFFERIRIKYGSIQIKATHIMINNSSYQNIDDKITELENNLSYFTAVNVSDCTLRNSNHWDYQGMKLISQRMRDIINIKDKKYALNNNKKLIHPTTGKILIF